MRKKTNLHPTKQFIFLILLLILLPVLVLAAQLAIKLFGKAAGTPANIVVDYNSDLGPLPQVWQALAQGGEEKNQMLSSVVNDIRELTPKYIRLDHLYDQYNLVKKNGQTIVYDFSELDRTIDDVLKTGALPYLSLSYMPSDFSSEGTVGKPHNWNDWSNLVKATVEHYSGKGSGQKNLDGVYYEVWNEPDLFGSWKTYGDKNYLDLYAASARGAANSNNVNSFKIGGPATTGMYYNWMKSFLDFIKNNNLRIDFISYHRYSKEMVSFNSDLSSLQDLLNGYRAFLTLPIIISEWGSDPGNSSLHDGNFDAIHTIAATRQMLDKIALAFTFEIKDGPGTKEYWGRWGLITHDKFGLNKKPKYYGLKFLNNIAGNRIKIDGEGSFVTAFGTKFKDNLRLMMVNYDVEQTHSESVPLTFNNLPPGSYSLKTIFLFGDKKEEFFQTNTGSFVKTIFMPSQSAAYLELLKLATNFSYSLGFFGNTGNWGLVLGENDLSLSFTKEQFNLPYQGNLEFFLKPLWNTDDERETLVFDAPLTGGKIFALKKRTISGKKRLEFGIYQDQNPQNTVFTDVSDWQKGRWHHLSMSWGKQGLAIFVDGQNSQANTTGIDFSLSGPLTFNHFGGVIDELRILNKAQETVVVPQQPYTSDADALLLRHFDQDVHK